jgi:hypothetical protein
LGAVFVVFGKTSGWAATSTLLSLNGTTGFRLDGPSANSYAGIYTASCDINGDAFDDLLIGATGMDINGADSGSAYVVFGKAAGWAASTSLATLDGATGFRLDGPSANSSAGEKIACADITGDGNEDFTLAAYWASNGGVANSGSVYGIYGSGGVWSATYNLEDLTVP